MMKNTLYMHPSGKINIGNYHVPYYDFGKQSNSRSIYIQSQIHGNETFGTLVLFDLIQKLTQINSNAFIGRIRIVPRVNPYSWHEYLYNSNGRFNPINGIDWNRIYNWDITPTDNDNSFAFSDISINESISNAVLSLLNGFTDIWDVHTPEHGIEHIYCSRYNPNYSYLGIKNIIEFGKSSINSLDESCIRMRDQKKLSVIEAITIELPSNSIATKKNVNEWSDRFIIELQKLQILKKIIISSQKAIQFNIGKWIDYNAKSDGIVQYNFELGQMLTTNNELFRIAPYNLQDIEIKHVEKDKVGLPICVRKKSMIKSGDWVVRVLKVMKNEDSVI